MPLLMYFFHFTSNNGYQVDFQGADVFFVISGFLMTSIIFNGVEKNTFNLFKFYTAQRIIPVLAAMSAILLIWLVLSTSN